VVKPSILASVGGSASTHMRALHKYDDELASESSEMMERETQLVPSRKPLVLGLCAALVVATMVVCTRMPIGLGEVAQNELIDLAAAGDCSSDTENCMSSKCCKIPGRKCFMKNEYWANCNDTCAPGHVDAYDRTHGITTGWNCSVLTKGQCAKDHEDCTGKDGCCSEGHVCYVKNEHWKNCNAGCQRGVGANKYEHSDYEHESWSCEIDELGQYCPDANLNQASDPAEHLKCCKDTFCIDKTDEECQTKICAFYYNATGTTNASGSTTTTPGNATGAATTVATTAATTAGTTAAATTAAPTTTTELILGH